MWDQRTQCGIKATQAGAQWQQAEVRGNWGETDQCPSACLCSASFQRKPQEQALGLRVRLGSCVGAGRGRCQGYRSEFLSVGGRIHLSIGVLTKYAVGVPDSTEGSLLAQRLTMVSKAAGETERLRGVDRRWPAHRCCCLRKALSVPEASNWLRLSPCPCQQQRLATLPSTVGKALCQFHAQLLGGLGAGKPPASRVAGAELRQRELGRLPEGLAKGQHRHLASRADNVFFFTSILTCLRTRREGPSHFILRRT